MKKNAKIMIGIITLIIAIVALAAVYFIFSPTPVQGSKSITINVIDDKQTITVYQLTTNAEYLREAMEEADGLTFSGTESEFGLMIDTVNGVVADYNTNGAYWSFNVNGDYCQYGIDTQPVLDGDEFSIEYTPASDMN